MILCFSFFQSDVIFTCDVAEHLQALSFSGCSVQYLALYWAVCTAVSHVLRYILSEFALLYCVQYIPVFLPFWTPQHFIFLYSVNPDDLLHSVLLQTHISNADS